MGSISTIILHFLQTAEKGRVVWPMADGSSSEIHTPAAALLGVFSVAAGALLIVSPILAIAIAPLVYGLTDLAASYAFGFAGPSGRVRVVARALASAAWGGVISTIVATRGGDSASVRLPLLAIALAIGTVIGVFGTAGQRAIDKRPPRAPLAESPLIGVCDVATAGFVFVNAVAAHGAEMRNRIMLLLVVSLTIALRALLVARLCQRDPESPRLAALGFVLWIALASIACTLAATPMTWSGLGAALVLTFAAALAESRKKRPLVVLLRGSLAFLFASMLGIATFLGS
jgi:hypothetical protein